MIIKNNVLQYGKIILNNVKYFSTYIYYKSNQQTKDGTRNMGIENNYLYKLEV
jgi:hypothetical protein